MRGEQHSGWSEDDIIEEALLRYVSRKEKANANAAEAYEKKLEIYEAGGGSGNPPTKPKKHCEEFKLMHAYQILKESSVFRRDPSILSSSRKRRRSMAKSSDDVLDSDTPCMYTVLIIIILSLLIWIEIAQRQLSMMFNQATAYATLRQMVMTSLSAFSKNPIRTILEKRLPRLPCRSNTSTIRWLGRTVSLWRVPR